MMAMQVKDLSKILEARAKLAASRGFTLEYQKEQEQSENRVAQPELAPATHDKYDDAAKNWVLWVLKIKSRLNYPLIYLEGGNFLEENQLILVG